MDIMLWFMWLMTQSEPNTTRHTIKHREYAGWRQVTGTDTRRQMECVARCHSFPLQDVTKSLCNAVKLLRLFLL
jgi:hypothetical protein